MITFLCRLSVVLLLCCFVFELWQVPFSARHSSLHFSRTSVWAPKPPSSNIFALCPIVYGTLVTAQRYLCFLAVPLAARGGPFFLCGLWPPKGFGHARFFHRSSRRRSQRHLGVLGVFLVCPLMRQYGSSGSQATLSLSPPPLFSRPGVRRRLSDAGIVCYNGHPLYHCRLPKSASLPSRAISAKPPSLLGATRWESTLKVVVPLPRGHFWFHFSGPCSGPLGETMAVTMVSAYHPRGQQNFSPLLPAI